MVERREVVVVELDLGTLDDAVPEADEDVLELAPRRGQQVQVAGVQRLAGQRHVDRLRAQPVLELARGQRGRALLEQRLERAPRLVAALAEPRPPLLGQRRDGAQDLRQLGLAPEIPHAQLLELVGRAGLQHGALALLRQVGESLHRLLGVERRVRHRSVHDIRRDRGSPSSRRSRESGRPTGIWATWSQADTICGGRPVRSAPSTNSGEPGMGSSRNGVPSPGTSATAKSLAARASAHDARTRGCPKIAPMLARTAFGPNGSAACGLSTTWPAPNASAARRIVPTLPGSATSWR